jgi:outer membrane protein TolC
LNPLFNPSSLNGGYLNNYKFGLSFNFPLFLRKERGELQQTKIKIENTAFDIINKRNELLNQTKATLNEFNIFRNQITIYSRNLSNYERLWQAERRLFDLGESSLFMINSRELSYINAQIKLNEIIYKNRTSALDVEYATGLLNSIY